MPQDKELLLRLLDLKLHDFMLAYGSMRVALEDVLENAPDVRGDVFQRLAETTIGMITMADDKIEDMLEGAKNEEEAIEIIDTFIDDMIAPARVLFLRYLGPDVGNNLLDNIFLAAQAELHDRVAEQYAPPEPEETTSIGSPENVN